jgi:hypothetical protein
MSRAADQPIRQLTYRCFRRQVSYVEIYMERIRDLLDPFKTKNNLQVGFWAAVDAQDLYAAPTAWVCIRASRGVPSPPTPSSAGLAVVVTECEALVIPCHLVSWHCLTPRRGHGCRCQVREDKRKGIYID